GEDEPRDDDHGGKAGQYAEQFLTPGAAGDDCEDQAEQEPVDDPQERQHEEQQSPGVGARIDTDIAGRPPMAQESRSPVGSRATEPDTEATPSRKTIPPVGRLFLNPDRLSSHPVGPHAPATPPGDPQASE